MIKGIVLSLLSFLYTLVYPLAFVVIYKFYHFVSNRLKYGGAASGGDGLWLVILILNAPPVLSAVFLFEKIRGYFICMYIASLLASFLMPFLASIFFRVTYGNLKWYASGAYAAATNLICGHAMLFLISYFIVNVVKKMKGA